jgi:hypothetical protein
MHGCEYFLSCLMTFTCICTDEEGKHEINGDEVKDKLAEKNRQLRTNANKQDKQPSKKTKR